MKIFKLIITAGILTLIFGMTYATVQQSLRLTADDPQIQIADDTAAKLDQGGAPRSVLGQTVDVSKSLAPFTIVYDKDANELASSGSASGISPRPPKGMLTAATTKHQNRVTWELESGVRIAAVVAQAENGDYVLSGRSLEQTEQRENTILLITILAWLTALALAGAFWLGHWQSEPE